MLHPIDIITRNNRRTGRISNPEDASNRGLWHRGVHVIIATPSGQLLVQKRSEDMIQHPGMLDIGVGGFVDSGETPEMAGIREVYEETGIKATTDQLIFLGVTKFNHRWRYKDRQKSVVRLYTVMPCGFPVKAMMSLLNTTKYHG
jgi:8-oxo-dGTP pyrophosphatase MutT (NUDIX family)